MTQKSHLTRRDMIKLAGAAAATGMLAGAAFSEPAARQSSPLPVPAAARRRSIRIAHLTDIHVQPERRASDGMIACLQHVQQLKDRPQLILTGGDSVFDSFEADDARTKLQWDLWHAAFKSENSIPLRSCIGNHDVWGGNKKKSFTTGAEPNYGKKRAIEMLHLDDRFYSFDQAGWHFIVLDSTQPDGLGGYTAFLDEAQYDWLARELVATDPKTPILILSHIPILTVTTILWAKEEQGNFSIDTSLMHGDCVKLKTLFAQHPNVKLCLSGHMHLIDRVDYNGVTYLCNGAVSGNWWKGRHKDCDEGYAVLDLYDDGSFTNEYVKYGWRAVAGQ